MFLFDFDVLFAPFKGQCQSVSKILPGLPAVMLHVNCYSHLRIAFQIPIGSLVIPPNLPEKTPQSLRLDNKEMHRQPWYTYLGASRERSRSIVLVVQCLASGQNNFVHNSDCILNITNSRIIIQRLWTTNTFCLETTRISLTKLVVPVPTSIHTN